MVHVAPVPDRFNDSVGEAEGQNILDGLFAEIMIDPVDLLFFQDLAELVIQVDGRGEIVAEWLFDHDAAPMPVFLLRQTRGAEVVYDNREKRRRGGEIKEHIARGACVFFQRGQASRRVV